MVIAMSWWNLPLRITSELDSKCSNLALAFSKLYMKVINKEFKGESYNIGFSTFECTQIHRVGQIESWQYTIKVYGTFIEKS